MPNYRFTTDDGDQVDRAEETIELADDRVAAEEAQKALADIAKEKLPYRSRADFHAHVEDEGGNEVYRASLQFRGATAEEGRAMQEWEDRAADDAAETVSKAISSSRRHS